MSRTLHSSSYTEVETMKVLGVKQLSIRIRREYFEAIVSGEKTVEYRKNSPYWQKRLCGMTAQEYGAVMSVADATFPFKEEPSETLIAVFVCGKRVHRRKVVLIERLKTPGWFSRQGQEDVDTDTCFALHLGREMKDPKHWKNNELCVCGAPSNPQIFSCETGLDYCSDECARAHVKASTPLEGW